jgi:hypothetical protein
MKTHALIAAVFAFGLSLSASAQTYVGDSACMGCHANMPEAGFFDAYMNSGHPWKILHTNGEEPSADTWPHTPVPPLPVVDGAQLEWSDIEYTVGNFFWKTRYMNHDGYLVTGAEGETTQWNLQTEEWVGYSAGTLKPFNCGRCHTTGYDPEGDSQHGLEGIVGSWEQDGVRCEACHGPSSNHISNPNNVQTPGGSACSACHYRDSEFRMPWSGGFMKHHQQSEDLTHSPHDFMTCMSCHNPHRSTVYNDGGMTASCLTCHPGNEDNGYYVVEEMENLSCKDCHMPPMGKSANVHGEYVADVRSHLFQVMTDAVYAEDNTYDVDGNLFWNQEDDGNAFVTLDYACLGCHIQINEPLTLSEAADFAQNIHTAHATAVREPAEVLPSSLQIKSVYPNPFNPSTTIHYTIDKPFVVDITVYDMSGAVVAALYNGPTKAGEHRQIFNADNMASGVYLVRITAGDEIAVRKIALLR